MGVISVRLDNDMEARLKREARAQVLKSGGYPDVAVGDACGRLSNDGRAVNVVDVHWRFLQSKYRKLIFPDFG